jgi:hypothetical protein
MTSSALLSVINVAHRYQPPMVRVLRDGEQPRPLAADINDARLPLLLLPALTGTVTRLFLGETLSADQLAKSRGYFAAPDPLEMLEQPARPQPPGLMWRDLREPILAELHDDLQALR